MTWWYDFDKHKKKHRLNALGLPAKEEDVEVMLKDADLDNDGHSPTEKGCQFPGSFQINGDVDLDDGVWVFYLDMLKANL